MRVAELTSSYGVPMVSPSATSPALSNRLSYPTFARVIPTDGIRMEALADFLANVFNYTRVALASSLDAFGVGGATSFANGADAAGIEIIARVEFEPIDSSEKGPTYKRLLTSAARVIVIIAQESNAGAFINGATRFGVGGPGYAQSDFKGARART